MTEKIRLEKIRKYLVNKDATDLENIGLSLPGMATGTVIPIGALLNELEREQEEARHKELVDLQEKILTEIKKKPKARKRDWKDLQGATQAVYTEAWNIYLAMCKEYENDVLDNSADTSKVTISDWRARVITEVYKGKKPWQPTERTLETVKAYGVAGNIPIKKPKN
ncbi:MAG: hypothetical protein JW963_09010 [Anaerolineales bacterium]|nr:hypothetical protein [Anaerolineales bacterium]